MPKTNDILTFGGTRHVVMQCGSCAVYHTVPEVIYDSAYREGGYWHCPNGHSRGWKDGADKTDLENMRRERDRLKQDAARLEDERRELAERAKRAEGAAQRAKATTKRLQKRASAGTCPCCNRTFSNMAEHMKHQHPGFVSYGGAKVVPIVRGA